MIGTSSEPNGNSWVVVSNEKSPPAGVIVKDVVVNPREGPSATGEVPATPPVTGIFDASKCTWISCASGVAVPTGVAGN